MMHFVQQGFILHLLCYAFLHTICWLAEKASDQNGQLHSGWNCGTQKKAKKPNPPPFPPAIFIESFLNSYQLAWFSLERTKPAVRVPVIHSSTTQPSSPPTPFTQQCEKTFGLKWTGSIPMTVFFWTWGILLKTGKC